MKKVSLWLVGIGVILVVPVAFAASSGVSLYNGGIGQLSSDATHFGFAVCNNGTASLQSPLPVTIAANGIVLNNSFTAAIDPNACVYSYLPYSSFKMIGGQTYSVSVTIDPQHTIISNSDNRATYSLKVPGQVLGASTTNTDLIRQQLVADLALLIKLVAELQALVNAGGH